MTILHDLQNYKHVALKGSLLVFVFLLCIYLFSKNYFFAGLLIGSTLANINIFVLAYAAYRYIIFNASFYALSISLLFFLFLVSVSGFIVFYYAHLALGFAVGLSSPLLIGALIALKKAPPLDQQSF
jgi:hypothetical protein